MAPRRQGSTTSIVPDTGVTPTHSMGPVAVAVTVSSTPHVGDAPEYVVEEYSAPLGWYSHDRTVVGAEVVVRPTRNATLNRPAWFTVVGSVQDVDPFLTCACITRVPGL
jgi:hypothetical protein